jgi:glycosyltransferase involved in cell wall biosynthesis
MHNRGLIGALKRQFFYGVAFFRYARLFFTQRHQPNLAVPVLRGEVLMQALSPEARDYSAIGVLFGTYARANSSHIRLQIFLRDATPVLDQAVSAEEIGDNTYFFIQLPEKVSTSGGFLCISSPDATPGNCVAVWTSSNRGFNGLRLAKEKAFRQRGASCPSVFQKAKTTGRAVVIQCLATEGSPLIRRYSRHWIADLTSVDRSVNVLLLTTPDSPPNAESLAVLQGRVRVVSSIEALEGSMALQPHICLLHRPIGFHATAQVAKTARKHRSPLWVWVDQSSGWTERAVADIEGAIDGLIGCSNALLIYGSPLQNTDRITLPMAWANLVDDIWLRYRQRRLPKVSIVTILSGSHYELESVVRSYFLQDYPGEIEVICVDDRIGISQEELRAIWRKVGSEKGPSNIGLTIITNPSNMGNCFSRNVGVKAASGDIVVVIDSDCVVNAGFVSGHVEAHGYADCDIVIGPCNIETGGIAPEVKLAELANNLEQAQTHAELQFPPLLDCFLNCVTRNFSIKASKIPEPLFDLDFSYSLDPTSGFGWEDIELGYRLHKAGQRIKFTSEAFSIHISHDPKVSDSAKALRSVRNFHKLLLKHPELARIAVQWVRDTLLALESWLERSHVEPVAADLITSVRALVLQSSCIPNRPVVSARAQLKILTYRWHVPHQYELYKSGHRFTLVTGAGSPMCDQWAFNQRPLPPNVDFVDVQRINPRDFDLAIVHFDENVVDYQNTNGVVGPDWGATFRFFIEQIDLPKVAVCHGTPQFFGQFNPGYKESNLLMVIESARLRLVGMLRDTLVICNSHQAETEWGFMRSRVVWHGFDPLEFAEAQYQKGILALMGPLVESRPHYRGLFLHQAVFDKNFPADHRPEGLFVPEPDVDYSENLYANAKFKNYVNALRRYSVYFNPTQRSPMPRSRGEAMMCGLVPVSAHNHDVHLFIENGRNGFYSNDASELREQSLFLVQNPSVCREMGKRARASAIDNFHISRYLSDWDSVLKAC